LTPTQQSAGWAVFGQKRSCEAASKIYFYRISGNGANDKGFSLRMTRLKIDDKFPYPFVKENVPYVIT